MHVLSELWLLEPLQGQLPGSQDQLGGVITDRITRSCLSACYIRKLLKRELIVQIISSLGSWECNFQSQLILLYKFLSAGKHCVTQVVCVALFVLLTRNQNRVFEIDIDNIFLEWTCYCYQIVQNLFYSVQDGWCWKDFSLLGEIYYADFLFFLSAPMLRVHISSHELF